jgi:hypothetical protein
MDETTPDVVMEGYEQAAETARLAGVPLKAVAAMAGIASEIDSMAIECPILTVRRIVQPPFAQTPERRTTGPLFVVN